MSQTVAGPSLREPMERLRRLVAWHPEWWAVASAAGAWAALLALGARPESSNFLCGAGSAPGALATWPDWARAALDWGVMLVAMMWPLILVPLRFVAFGSRWSRRHRASALFLVGYMLPWIPVAVASLAGLAAVKSETVAGDRQGFVVACALATLWQVTPWRRRLSVACHRTCPLPPDGWPADRACLLFGVGQGVACCATCGVLMFAVMLSPWHLTAMVAATALLAYERYRARRWDRRVAIALTALTVIGAVA